MTRLRHLLRALTPRRAAQPAPAAAVGGPEAVRDRLDAMVAENQVMGLYEGVRGR